MPRRSALFLLLLVTGPAGCGGKHSPDGPTTMPTPPGTSVTLVLFYDENANGVADGDEVARVPDVEVSVEERTAVPPIAGRAVLTGGAAGTVAVAPLAALTTPSGFVAVTTIRSRLPSSPTPSVYVGEVAPGTFVHVVPSADACHW